MTPIVFFLLLPIIILMMGGKKKALPEGKPVKPWNRTRELREWNEPEDSP